MNNNVRFSRYQLGTIPGLLILHSLCAMADGVVVDKIYHPYVEAMEQELEFRVVYQDHQHGEPDNQQTQRFAYGRSFNDRWFGEVYIVGEKNAGQSLDAKAVELEVIHQLTEQGEYWADWGLVFELEKSIGEHIWEAGAGVLVEKELGLWSFTGNFIVAQEWGEDIDDELESTLGLQTRYRFSQGFEPALEYHMGQNTKALGPVFMGDIDAGIHRLVHWEIGWLVGLDSDSPDHSVRAGIEYEF